MKKIFLSLLTVIFIIACNNQPKSVSDNSVTTTKPDTAKPALSPETQKLLSHFKDGSMPVDIDSVYMAKADKGDSLGSKQVRMLVNTSMVKIHDVNSSYENALEDFYTIDSVKA